MQTHVIPYSLVGFVHAFQVRIYTCISRSREHKCPNYVPLEGKIICPYWYNHEDIQDFESNNSIKCCHEVRIGRQNVHANKVYSGKEKKKRNTVPEPAKSQWTPLSKFVIWIAMTKGERSKRQPFNSLWWLIYVLNSFVNNYLLYSPTDAAPRFL